MTYMDSNVVKDILSEDFWIMPATPEYINEGIPYITSKNIKNGKIDFTKVNYISQEVYENISKNRPIKIGDILISMIGTLGETAEITEKDGKFYGQNMFLIRLDDEKINRRYFLNFFKSNRVKRDLESKQNQSTQKYLKANHIEDLIIPIPSISKQIEIANQLDKLQSIITHLRTQLEKLNLLVKARFVEMFGEPVHNTFQLPTMPMTNICEIIDGDRGKNYPKQEEFFSKEYCLFLNAKNVTKYGFNFSECLFITKEKDAILRKGKLQRGDVVLTTRGTLGNLAFYTKEIPFENIRINSGMVILRMNRKVINETFFIEQFRMQVDDIKQSIASGSAQPQLPISTMNKINIITPELELQTQFANFVKQVDQSKSILQQELTQTQTLFDSLMQEYFG